MVPSEPGTSGVAAKVAALTTALTVTHGLWRGYPHRQSYRNGHAPSDRAAIDQDARRVRARPGGRFFRLTKARTPALFWPEVLSRLSQPEPLWYWMLAVHSMRPPPSLCTVM